MKTIYKEFMDDAIDGKIENFDTGYKRDILINYVEDVESILEDFCDWAEKHNYF